MTATRLSEMQDHSLTLQATIDSTRESPQSGGALILYALANTINYEQAGCLFKLDKLRDLSAEQRNLAYALMEVMVSGGNQGRVKSGNRQCCRWMRWCEGKVLNLQNRDWASGRAAIAGNIHPAAAQR